MKPIIILSLLLTLTSNVAAQIKDMRVEHEHEPLGIDVERPCFSWQMATDTGRHGQCQRAWQIAVADENGRTTWDSGKRNGSQSTNIRYNGQPLKPSTRYRWMLKVWNERGKEKCDTAYFETGLKHKGDWSGAQWIGEHDGELPLYAQYLPVFTIEYGVQLDRKTRSSKASFVYGANDLRLAGRNRNILGMQNGHDQSYIKVEIVASTDTARLNIFRVGYKDSDRADKPFRTIAIPTNIVNKANRYSVHNIRITSVLGTTRFYIDGNKKEIGKVELNPMGIGGDFIAFPVVGDYGFSVPKGQKARFTGVRVGNFRSPSNAIKELVEDTTVTESVIRTTKIKGLSEPLLRTEFNVDKLIAKARLYVTARGTYQFYVNGNRIGNDYLNPGLTQYNKTHFYQTYDVTPFLMKGSNAVGAQLAEGWWRGGSTFVGENWNVFGDRSSLLAKLVITYSDGTTSTIVTNPDTWLCNSHGPLLCGSLFQGEVYDGIRAEAFDGWNKPGFDTTGWHKTSAISTDCTVSKAGNDDMPHVYDFSKLSLTAQQGPTIMAVDTLTAQSVEQVRPGVYIYDMGQNMAGVPLITLDGMKKGQRINLRFAEVKYPNMPQYGENKGMIMLENIRAAMAQDIYTARGGHETFAPRFTYHGYRYIEITGIDRPLPLKAVRSKVLSSVHKFTADYTTSNADINRLWKNITWSMRANFFSIPTDCPQRNERMGWSGDISVFAPTATYMTDAYTFLRRHMTAMRDVQRQDGKFLDIAPIGGGFGGILWGSAGIVLPWQCYLQYGDTAILKENYASMCRYIDFITNKTIDPKTGVIVQDKYWGDLADWLGPEDGRNDRSLLWEAYYIYDLDMMERIAKMLGNDADACRFASMAARRRTFFNKTYIAPTTAKTIWSAFDKKRKGCLVDTQTSYVLPLAFNIVADSVRQRFTDNLVLTVERPNGTFSPYSLMTGFIGTAWVSKVLSDNGRSDLAYRMMCQTSYPSWLYSVKQGATTIWERLNSYTHKDGFGRNNRMNSFNHYSFGAVGNWMMSRSLGISNDEQRPGFQHFILRPEPDPTGELSYASGYYDSPYGRIESAWRIANGSITYDFTIPANTSATLYLKANKVNGKQKGVKTLSKKNGIVVMELSSGRYSFTTNM